MADPKDTKPKPRFDQTYLNARTEWMERYGSYIAAARNWRFVAVGSLAVTLLSLAANWHLATKSGTVPFILEVDREGHAFYAGTPQMAAVDDPLITRATLESWIRNTRSVLSDPRAQRHYVDAAYAFLAKGSTAYRLLSSYDADHDPFVIGTKETVDVQNLNALPIGNEQQTHTWTVTWDEQTILNDGTTPPLEHWRANITFQRVAVNLNDPRIGDNPTGLFITNFSWAKQ